MGSDEAYLDTLLRSMMDGNSSSDEVPSSTQQNNEKSATMQTEDSMDELLFDTQNSLERAEKMPADKSGVEEIALETVKEEELPSEVTAEEVAEEPAAEAGPTLEELAAQGDPNKAMSADEIAALFAAAGGAEEAPAEVTEEMAEELAAEVAEVEETTAEEVAEEPAAEAGPTLEELAAQGDSRSNIGRIGSAGRPE